MKTILITAYAINPFKGSEDGTGWNIVREIAEEFNVILITRKNNIQHLDRYFSMEGTATNGRIEYYGFDLPDWVLKLKKKSGTKGHVAYFYLWQKRVVDFLKERSFNFSISLSLNFHSDSHPHFLWKLEKPCLWGPIGHHPKIPKSFVLKSYGLRAYLIDRFFYRMKWLMRNVNPSFRKAVRESERIFVINSSIRSVIGAPASKTIELPAVAAKRVDSSIKRGHKGFTILCAGRFHFMKGLDVALRSFFLFMAHLPKHEREQAQLILVGKGSEKEALQRIAAESQFRNHVKWIDWVDHSEMDQLYDESDIFLFPSHEGAGMVVPEAMSHGLPVLTFDNVGPGELVGVEELTVPYQKYDQSTRGFASKLLELYRDESKRLQLQRCMKQRHEDHFTWASKGKIIRKELNQILKAS